MLGLNSADNLSEAGARPQTNTHAPSRYCARIMKRVRDVYVCLCLFVYSGTVAGLLGACVRGPKRTAVHQQYECDPAEERALSAAVNGID